MMHATLTEIRYSFIKTLKELMPEETLVDDLERVYLPLANLISVGLNVADRTQVIGINGAQGAGKTTFANLLKSVLETGYKMNVLLWSIDDLYFDRSERKRLADEVHPLLITRGVPGTHNIELGKQVLNKLCKASPNEKTKIPRFDKAIDEPFPESEWDVFTGRPDVILFDGWIMGAMEQPEEQLIEPINDLEKEEDPDGTWRSYVNNQLKTVYKSFFENLDLLVMLKVPSFEKVFEWRHLQEIKLRLKAQELKQKQKQNELRIMDDEELKRFISHYERLTLFMLNEIPDRADMFFRISDDHRICI